MKNKLIHKEDNIPVELQCRRCRQFPKKPVKCLFHRCQIIQCYKCSLEDKAKNICTLSCLEFLQIGPLNEFENFYFKIQNIICKICLCQVKGLEFQNHQKFCRLNKEKQQIQVQINQLGCCQLCSQQNLFKCKYCYSYQCVNFCLSNCQCGLKSFYFLDDQDYFLRQESQCQDCKQKFNQIDLQNHKQTCQQAKIQCEYCEYQDKRILIQQHIQDCLQKSKNLAEIEYSQLYLANQILHMQLKQLDLQIKQQQFESRQTSQQINQQLNDDSLQI
ncbi:hypothetical protein pb186bvf_003114 [Paramecium bursaria]